MSDTLVTKGRRKKLFLEDWDLCLRCGTICGGADYCSDTCSEAARDDEEEEEEKWTN